MNPSLISRVIIFEVHVVQPMRPTLQTDGQTTCRLVAVLRSAYHCAVKTFAFAYSPKMPITKILWLRLKIENCSAESYSRTTIKLVCDRSVFRCDARIHCGVQQHSVLNPAPCRQPLFQYLEFIGLLYPVVCCIRMDAAMHC